MVPKRLLISPITIVINLCFLDIVLAYLQLLYEIASYPTQVCWQNLGTLSCKSEQCGMPLGVYHEFWEYLLTKRLPPSPWAIFCFIIFKVNFSCFLIRDWPFNTGIWGGGMKNLINDLNYIPPSHTQKNQSPPEGIKKPFEGHISYRSTKIQLFFFKTFFSGHPISLEPQVGSVIEISQFYWMVVTQ